MKKLSFSVTPVKLIKNDKGLSFGTGFFYQAAWGNENCIFLITNYHVITGIKTEERKTKQPEGDSISFYYHIDKNDPKPVVEIKMPIFTKDGQAIWLEHNNSKVDVIAIPMLFSLPAPPKWHTIRKSLNDSEAGFSPCDPITIVGYPKGFLDSVNALPIYKTGNIASEYEYDFDGDPCFIVDVAAFSGNSGSPVFSIRKNAQIASQKIILQAPGETIDFLGIYSAGMIVVRGHKIPIREIYNNPRGSHGIITDLDLQLGVVWKAKLIEEIIEQGSFTNYKKIVEKYIKEGGFKFKITRGLKIEEDK
ncbi:hypothetical protein COT77_00035 [Candidatus Berkelbacteria bacterium CG10_big_fil_rev_8_21_14_0_10_41_12]|uniref:Serine protease n=1 Tax=Candidatus Berkelbacteria bacterium CG10_big_fil_rev_8_21_14_0_10_41_12 TaxID=1974513 RepID=A0A2M6WY57_9BACT|nr:MAG: hypothetical protein COT77_00035 [Candidatus Berkelbacteria bacterium CG10_big_fil_rev_8_21_14_0_10_41_12]